MANENEIVIITSVEGGDESAKALNTVSDAVERVGTTYEDTTSAAEDFAGLIKELTGALKENVTATKDNTTAFYDLSRAIVEATTSTQEDTIAIEASNTERKETITLLEDEITALKNENIALNENLAVTEKTTTALGERLAALEANIGAQKTFNTETAVGAAASGDAAAGISGFYDKLGTLSKIGTPAILKAGAWSAIALGGVAYEGIKSFSSLNAELTQSITQAGRAANSMPFLQSTALNVAKQTGVSFKDIGNIIYRVSSATAAWNGGLGATNTQLAQMTRQVANLNVLGGVGGGAPAEQSARVLGAIMNANLSDVGNNAEKAAALINAGTGAGDIKQSELISALGRGLLASAAAHGVSGQSAISFVDLLTTLGTPGSTAGQYAKTALTLMTAPSSQGAKSLAMLGIEPGQLNTLMRSPGGIVAASSYLKQALDKFDPTAFNIAYKGKTGYAGASALLENWGVGDIPTNVIQAWAKGNLGSLSAKDLGTEHSGANGAAVSGADWLNTLQNLIITKAFGGSRSSATIDALLNDLPGLQNIYGYIGSHTTSAAYNKAVQRAESTPAAQFNKMKQSLMADFVQVGQTLTPWALHLGNAFKDIVGALTKFKPVIVLFLSAAGSLGALAALAKGAEIGRGAMRLIGSGYNLTTGFYKNRGLVTDEDIAAGNFRGRVFGGGKFGNKLGSIASAYEEKSLGLLKVIAENTAKTSVLQQNGNLMQKAESDAVKKAESEVEQKGISDLETYGPRLSEIQHGPLQSEIRPLSNIEKWYEANPNATRMPRQTKKYLNSLDEADEAARGGASSGLSSELQAKLDAGGQLVTAPGNKVGVIASDAVSDVESVAGKEGGGIVKGLFGGLMEGGAGDLISGGLGMLGGPVGMMLMTSLTPMLMPLAGKLFSSIGSWFSSPKIQQVTGGKTSNIVQNTQTGLTGEISAVNQKMAAIQKNFNKGNYSQLGEYENLQTQLATLNGQQSYYGGAGAGLNAKGIAAQKAQGASMLATYGGILGLQSIVSNVDPSSYQSQATGVLNLQAQLKKMGWSGSVAKGILAAAKAGNWSLVNKDLSGSKSAALASIYGNMGGVTANDPNFFNKLNAGTISANQLSRSNFDNYILTQRVSGLSNVAAQGRYIDLMKAATTYKSRESLDESLSKNTKFDSKTREIYAEAATKLAKQVKIFDDKADNIKREYNFSKSTMTTLANLITSGSKASMTELGLTSTGLQQAFSSALGTGGMTALIANINKNITKGHI